MLTVPPKLSAAIRGGGDTLLCNLYTRPYKHTYRKQCRQNAEIERGERRHTWQQHWPYFTCRKKVMEATKLEKTSNEADQCT